MYDNSVFPTLYVMSQLIGVYMSYYIFAQEFDIWEDESLADNCATFINDEIPEDSIVLVSVAQVVASRIEQLPGLWEALAKLGAIKRFRFFGQHLTVYIAVILMHTCGCNDREDNIPATKFTKISKKRSILYYCFHIMTF